MIRDILMNWSFYNDSLVRKGEVLLDFSILEMGARFRKRGVE